MTKSKTKKETRGGTRRNSGAKPKYNEETKTVAFRCPLSKVDELKIIVKSKLSEWSVKQQLTFSGLAKERNLENRISALIPQFKNFTNAHSELPQPFFCQTVCQALLRFLSRSPMVEKINLFVNKKAIHLLYI